MKNLLTYILAGLLVAALGYIGWLYFNPKIEKVYVQIKPKPEILYVPRADGGVTATTTIIREPQLPVDEEEFKRKWSALVPVSEQRSQKINELTEIKGTLSTELTKVQDEKNKLLAENAELKKSVQVWKGKYYTFTANDSTGKGHLTGDLAIKIAGVKKDRYGNTMEISATSDDPDFKINGLETYRQEIKIPKRRFGIGFQGGYYYVPQVGKFYPAVGFGLSYNLIRF